MSQHKIQKQESQCMLHTTNSQSSPATTQLSKFGCLKGGEWKGKREEGNKGARQHNTSHSETPPGPQQEQEGICHQVWLGEVQDRHSSCQPQQSPPKNQIIPCQGKVFCSHTMQQHGLGEIFFPPLGKYYWFKNHQFMQDSWWNISRWWSWDRKPPGNPTAFKTMRCYERHAWRRIHAGYPMPSMHWDKCLFLQFLQQLSEMKRFKKK